MNKAGSQVESTIKSTQTKKNRVYLNFTPEVSRCTIPIICIYLHKLSNSRPSEYDVKKSNIICVCVCAVILLNLNHYF